MDSRGEDSKLRSYREYCLHGLANSFEETKLTEVTPKSFIRGTVFTEGIFDCKELERAIL